MRKLYLIEKGTKPNNRIPTYSFIANSNNEAILWFKGYLIDTSLQNSQDYMLYQIGEFNEQNKLETCKIFITGGFEVKSRNEEGYYIKQKKLELKKANEEYIKQCEITEELNNLFNKNKNVTEKTRMLFEGKLINE